MEAVSVGTESIYRSNKVIKDFSLLLSGQSTNNDQEIAAVLAQMVRQALQAPPPLRLQSPQVPDSQR